MIKRLGSAILAAMGVVCMGSMAWADATISYSGAFLCVGRTLHAIGGVTPEEPVLPKITAMPARADLVELPAWKFASGVSPETWCALGPFSKKQGEAADRLAAVGGVPNAVLKAGTVLEQAGGTNLTVTALKDDHWWQDANFTRGMKSVNVTAVLNRKWDSIGYFFAVVEFDGPRHVEFHGLTPGGGQWNSRDVLDFSARVNGAGVKEGETLNLEAGRHAVLVRVTMGRCEEWGKIWFAPRFKNVDGDVVRRQKECERAARESKQNLAATEGLFVL